MIKFTLGRMVLKENQPKKQVNFCQNYYKHKPYQ